MLTLYKPTYNPHLLEVSISWVIYSQQCHPLADCLAVTSSVISKWNKENDVFFFFESEPTVNQGRLEIDFAHAVSGLSPIEVVVVASCCEPWHHLSPSDSQRPSTPLQRLLISPLSSQSTHSTPGVERKRRLCLDIWKAPETSHCVLTDCDHCDRSESVQLMTQLSPLVLPVSCGGQLLPCQILLVCNRQYRHIL